MINRLTVRKQSKSAAFRRKKRLKVARLIGSLLMAFSLAASLFLPATAENSEDSRESILQASQRTADYILKTVTNPYPGGSGGEWVILALKEGGYQVPEGYFETYYKNLESFLADCGGVISTRKYAEYSRTILGVTAAGYDARSVNGYDLTLPLGDYEKTLVQGINGPIWALMALDRGKYEIPANGEAKTQATRELYIDSILSREKPDGGFAFMGNYADADITAMAIQALYRYRYKPEVSAALNRAVTKLSMLQQEDGGYLSLGDPNSESAAQVILALCRLGISINDPRFIKNGISLLDNLLSYQNEDGSFCHLRDDGGDQTATEQAFQALSALRKLALKKHRDETRLRRSISILGGGGRLKGIRAL
jgi:hypothetical protein